eukprot:6530839-Prymnesium_polylepis.1
MVCTRAHVNRTRTRQVIAANAMGAVGMCACACAVLVCGAGRAHLGVEGSAQSAHTSRSPHALRRGPITPHRSECGALSRGILTPSPSQLRRRRLFTPPVHTGPP